MSNLAIEVNQLGKRYKFYQRAVDRVYDAFGLSFLCKDCQDFWALRYVDLQIQRGERVGFIGRNGAGKSTLLKMIIGNVTPTEGSVRVHGNVQALMELGTGFHPEFTGRENIRASLSYHGLSAREIANKEEEIIDFSELDEFIDQPIKTYSAGMYARLAFSTATSIEPEILIIDEVLGAGDAYFAGKCVERMKNLTDRSGTTVLFVSHDLSSVLNLCDRAIWIDKGKVVGDDTPLKIVKEYNAMVRREEEIRLRARDLKVSKNHTISLENRDDLYQSMLFHFVFPDSEQEPHAKVYDIKLLVNGEQFSTIDVGDPMDNLADKECFIIDTKGYMDWGPPQRDTHGTYRVVKDFGGRYHHAPFQFLVPRHYLDNNSSIQVQLTADVSSAGNVVLEVFDGTKYKTLGTLSPGHGVQAFSVMIETTRAEQIIPLEDGSKSDSISETSRSDLSIDEYGDGGARIVAVRLKDSLGREVRVLEVGAEVSVEIEYLADHELENATFVFCVYEPDGKTATQWVADRTHLGYEVLPNKGCVSFLLDRLILGKGSYVASAAIFKTPPVRGIEVDSYHVLDRCIHFEIRQPIDDPIDRGICVHPYEVILR